MTGQSSFSRETDKVGESMSRPSVLILGLSAALCGFSLWGAVAVAATHAAPFNDHNATQVFQKNQSGGFQQVVAKDPNDKALVAAIRSYLEAEAERFGNGDYSGAFKGVRHLKAVKPAQIQIIYRNVQAGAAIDYVGTDAASVDAIHTWFDAEIPDLE
jgi:hypothetical protein